MPVKVVDHLLLQVEKKKKLFKTKAEFYLQMYLYL